MRGSRSRIPPVRKQRPVGEPTQDSHDNGPLKLFAEADERVLLRAIVEEFDKSDTVMLDVSELDGDGWLADDEAVQASLRQAGTGRQAHRSLLPRAPSMRTFSQAQLRY